MDLFRAAFNQFINENADTDDASCNASDECAHEEVNWDEKKRVCVDCGEILSEGCLVVQPGGGNLQKQRKTEASIYKDIPFFISHDTKEMTVKMYRLVTGSETYRNTFKRSIIFACLHRASIICNEGICFDDILDLMNLKTYEASKGVNYVTIRLGKDSTYVIPLFTDETSIASIISNLGVNIDPHTVKQIFKIVKKKSDILNNSHYKSVVCGCVFFWMRMNNVPMTMKQFVSKINMTELTIVKKYTSIAEVIFKMTLKKLYAFVLNKTPRKRTRKSKQIRAPKENDLYLYKERLTVNDYKNINKFSVTTVKGNVLPLEDVDDITEWNMLLNNTYYDHKGCVMSPGLSIVQTPKELQIDFASFDSATGLNGKEEFKSIIADECQEFC